MLDTSRILRYEDHDSQVLGVENQGELELFDHDPARQSLILQGHLMTKNIEKWSIDVHPTRGGWVTIEGLHRLPSELVYVSNEWDNSTNSYFMYPINMEQLRAQGQLKIEEYKVMHRSEKPERVRREIRYNLIAQVFSHWTDEYGLAKFLLFFDDNSYKYMNRHKEYVFTPDFF